MTLDGLYSIEKFSFDGKVIESVLSLDRAHWLFNVHFPGKPIVPGAVLLSIAAEICGKALGKKMRVSKLSDAKFKAAVEPDSAQRLEVSIALSDEDGKTKAKISYSIVQAEEKTAAASLTALLETVLSDTCFVIPFYNNPDTVKEVITSVMNAGYAAVAVNDGSTDGRSLDEASAAGPSALVSYEKNKGKGYAIRQGFKKALEMGFKYAVVFDADGQHTLSGAQAMIDKSLSLEDKERQKSIIVGSRSKRGADSGGKFANNFSNFWLTVQTGRKVGDTQSGLRLYPLEKICRINFLGNRYEFETEVLARMAWRGFRLVEVPVDVIYPEDRVTHFRKGADFTRISFMNTFLTLGAAFYGYPRMLVEKLRR
ncbi:MAG: glycosyltransferase [Bacteroidales bacterium]|nr:glycosyltransferase [Bacteroidales bacterium]